MVDTIRVTEYDDHWTCGEENCCDFYETVSVFHLNGEEYEYRGTDNHVNLLSFLWDHFNIGFEVEYEKPEE